MGTPTNRTPVRVARGTYSNLNTNKADIQGSEIVYATDQNKLYVKEGTDLVDANTQDISGKANLSGADFTGPINVGVDDTGQDVKFFGATSGRYWQWDESEDKMVVNGTTDLHNQVNIKSGAGYFHLENTGAFKVVYDKTAGYSGVSWTNAIDATKTYVKLYGGEESGNDNDASVKLQTKTTGVDITGDLSVTGSIVLEGATADAHETTLAVTDPTADRTITFPDATGTVALGVIGTDIQAHDADTAKLDVDQTWTGAQRGAVTALTDAGTIAVDFNDGNNFSLRIAGNHTLGQPTNQVAGQSGSIFITQDGTGSRTLSYHADWKWAGGTAPTLSTAADTVDRLDYIVAEANKIHAVVTLAVA